LGGGEEVLFFFQAGLCVGGFGLCVKATRGGTVGRAFAFNVGETYEYDALDAFLDGDAAEVLKPGGVGGGEETFRARFKENSGKVNDRIAVFEARAKAFGVGEVASCDFYPRRVGDIAGQVFAVDE